MSVYSIFITCDYVKKNIKSHPYVPIKNSISLSLCLLKNKFLQLCSHTALSKPREGKKKKKMEMKQRAKELYLKEEHENKMKKNQQFWRVMDDTELSLAPSSKSMNCSSSESETDSSKKRKYYWDDVKKEPSFTQTSLELQLEDPLPLDWEQCLDLQSGRMYYVNRKTLRRSWNCPAEQNLDLQLNMSTLTSSDGSSSSSTEMLESSKKRNSSSSNTMFAVACLKCHLLVMLCKSSPFCPNCKYVNPPPTQQSPKTKTLNTLSLLN